MGVSPAGEGVVARFFQKVSKDSMPPNNVVKIVESANKTSPARPPFGGIQMNASSLCLAGGVGGIYEFKSVTKNEP